MYMVEWLIVPHRSLSSLHFSLLFFFIIFSFCYLDWINSVVLSSNLNWPIFKFSNSFFYLFSSPVEPLYWIFLFHHCSFNTLLICIDILCFVRHCSDGSFRFSGGSSLSLFELVHSCKSHVCVSSQTVSITCLFFFFSCMWAMLPYFLPDWQFFVENGHFEYYHMAKMGMRFSPVFLAACFS